MFNRVLIKILDVNFRGLMLGIAIADAFGGGVEWQSREWMRENVKFDKYINSRPGSWAVGFQEGMYTDDTEMNIGVVTSTIFYNNVLSYNIYLFVDNINCFYFSTILLFHTCITYSFFYR